MKPYLLRIRFGVHVPDCEGQLDEILKTERLVYGTDIEDASKKLKEDIIKNFKHRCKDAIIMENSIEITSLTIE
jgi:hypothetical protein